MSTFPINNSLQNESDSPDFYYTCQPNGQPWASLADVTPTAFPLAYRAPGKQVFVQSGNDVLKYKLDMNLNWVLEGGGTGGATAIAWTTNIPLGGIPSNTQIPIGTLHDDLFKRLTTAVFQPTITDPSFGLSSNAGALRKVDEVLALVLTFNFNRGLIDNSQLNTANEARAGAAIGYTFYGALGIPLPSQPQAGNTLSLSHTVAMGINAHSAKVAYGVGPQPKDGAGNNFGAPYPAGESAVQHTQFEGVFPFYATITSILTHQELPLYSMLTGNNIEISLIAESGGYKQRFLLPKVMLDARPITKIEEFNTVSGQFDPTNQLNKYDPYLWGVPINGQQYIQYVYWGSARGATKIKLIF